MKRQVLIYGIVGGLLVALLQWMQYRFLVIEHATEIYASLIAAVFAALGIWLGLRLKTALQHRSVEQAPHPGPANSSNLIPQAQAAFVPDESKRESLNITRRELEILALVAQGMSNREIAAKLFVSENTVKTHCARSFDKLGAARRTQAVQRGKELGLLP